MSTERWWNKTVGKKVKLLFFIQCSPLSKTTLLFLESSQTLLVCPANSKDVEDEYEAAVKYRVIEKDGRDLKPL